MSSRTTRPQLRIDKSDGVTLGGGGVIETGGTSAAPGVATLGAPQNLKVTGTALVVSDLVPSALANLSWSRPATPGPVASYLIQWSLASNFTNPTGTPVPGTQATAAIGGLPCGRTVYFRIAAIAAGGVQGAWSAGVSTATPSDTTPPAAPTSLGTSWSGLTGDLLITWTNPTSANFRDVRVRIYASNGGALLREVYSSAGRFVWTRGMQYADTSGDYDASVYLVLTARSVGGTLSATDLTGTATLAAPAQPSGLTSSWASDTGTAASDCLITWTASSAVVLYRLSIDGVARDVVGGRFLYTLDNNRAEHSGTPDPALSLSLVAVDALGQSSTAATTTATNAAPPATTISAFAGFSQAVLTITASAAQDLQDYRVRVYRNSSLVRTLYTVSTTLTYAVEDGDGTYQFDVAARDRFGQLGTASSQTSGQALTDLAGFVTTLRSGLIYSDSTGTAADTLAGLKDADTGTTVVTYSSSTPWRSTTGDWQEEITHQTSELSLSATASCYIGVSRDGSTWTWYAGGTAASGRWQPVAQASEAAAQAAATSLAAGVWRVDIPAPARCRYIRLGHRNTGASYALREFFPSTLLRGTYVEAESITSVLIAANAIVADKIAAGAVTATKLSADAIDGKTITGATIRTAASGARAELTSAGLKTYNSAGQVVIEATTTTDGALRAGAGALTLDNKGLTLDGTYAAGAIIDLPSVIKWVKSGVAYAYVQSFDNGNTDGRQLNLAVTSTSTKSGQLTLSYTSASAAGTRTSRMTMGVDGAGTGNVVEFVTDILGSAGTTGVGAYHGDAVYLTGTVKVVGNYVLVNGKTAIRSNDTWLRLNQNAAGSSDFSSGIYTPGAIRVDGGSDLRNGVTVTTGNLSVSAGSLASRGSSAALFFEDRSTALDWAWYASGNLARLYYNGADYAQVNTSGNWGFRMAPWTGATLSVKGQGTGTTTYGLAVYDSSGTTVTMSVRDDGTLYAKTNPITYSDMRLKRDIADLVNPLDTVLRLRPRSFYMRGDRDGRRRLGVIAQEAIKVVPDLVHLGTHPGRDEPEYSFDYIGLIAPTIGSVQQLYTMVRGVQSELEAIKAKLA